MLQFAVKLDDAQERLVATLEALLPKLATSTGGVFAKFFTKIFRKKGAMAQGVYIYGTVGSGKTMIGQAFYHEADCPKEFVHYQDFMRQIHEQIHARQDRTTSDLLLTIAKLKAAEVKLLCIDEFEIHDIADAMIIERLFSALSSYNVVLVITSNVPPEKLYMDGLQRENFLPFISLLQKKYQIFELGSNHDYRLDHVRSLEQRVLYPLTAENLACLEDIKANLTDKYHYSQAKIKIFGREILFERSYKTVLVVDFKELCDQPFAASDFVAICENFSAIIMENVPYIKADETDIVIRFINFIDNCYFHKTLLVISLIDAPVAIYPQGKRVKEFGRTVSRLHEMNSSNYLTHCKHK